MATPMKPEAAGHYSTSTRGSSPENRLQNRSLDVFLLSDAIP
jgi:hypothetical protein